LVDEDREEQGNRLLPPRRCPSSNAERRCSRADRDSPTPQDEALAQSERDELFASLRRLPEAQAEVIVLAFYGELSHSEIATQLDLPRGNR
jgi:RNA polymerase sigma factor (sigma-70 family)